MSAVRPSLPCHMPLLSIHEAPEDSLALWDDDEVQVLSFLLLTPRAGECDFDASAVDTPLKTKVVGKSDRGNRPKRQRPSLLPIEAVGKRNKPRLKKLPAPSAGFKTLTSTQCLQHIHKSFQLLTEAKQTLYKREENKPVNNKSLNGWQLRCTNAAQAATNTSQSLMPFYLLSKRFTEHTVQELMHRTWQLWTDSSALMRMFPSKQIDLKILQRFNGDGLIVRQVTTDTTGATTPWGPQQWHSVYMLFRIETKQGFTLCARSLDASGVDCAPVFHWITFCSEEGSEEVHAEFGSNVVVPSITFPGVENGGAPCYGLRAALKPAISRDIWALLQWEQLIVEPSRVVRNS